MWRCISMGGVYIYMCLVLSHTSNVLLCLMLVSVTKYVGVSERHNMLARVDLSDKDLTLIRKASDKMQFPTTQPCIDHDLV